MKNVQELTAAAARRRSFAAAMSKGASGNSETQQKAPGTVAGIDAQRAAEGSNDPSSYGAHAAQLVHAAHKHGKHRLASAITSVAHTPHPSDKMEVARNYLATVAPEEKVAHATAFTPKLMMVNQ